MLSIVIPAYNQPDKLGLVLRAIQEQAEMLKHEVIVVNDGGLPELGEVVAKADYRYLYLDPPTDEFRAGMARNLGAAHAQGERILFLDSDCVPRGLCLKNHASYGAKRDVVAGAIQIVEYEGRYGWHTPPTELRTRAVRQDRRYRLYMLHDKLRESKCFATNDYRPFWSGHLSVPAREFRALGGFWEEIKGYGSEDQELAWRMREAGCPLIIDFTSLVHHIGEQRLQNSAAKRLETLRLTQEVGSFVRRGRFLPILSQPTINPILN